MPWIVKNLWLIPVLPMLAAGLSALAPQRCRKFSASLAIGSMVISFLLATCAFLRVLNHHEETGTQVFNFDWFQFGNQTVQLGWVLDPLTAVMLVMVTFVGTLIFIYSVGYMSHDENFTRFFTFLSLFAGAMLGVVIANSLLLLFICWELVGLTSYLLIGFWYHKPSAAAAAKKAFITTRIGDMALLIGMVWLYSRVGTLIFYGDDGSGCLQVSRLALPALRVSHFGFTILTAIGLLIFAGAVGKSGQVPLHVWLPDAMEGPTPVSALIHAATMVAAGVFLVARMYPLMSAESGAISTMHVVTWVGAITAIFAASIAVAQTDIKRILAYSTVSQLGYMMMGLGVGGVAVGMFHLVTHAFFKALLFLGAGSVIHGCHEEQDICRMGGLRKYMPITFATYAIGMMALSGVPFLFSGFWSKDAILHAAHNWPGSRGPFYLGLAGAFLTAFYMTRQVFYVFFGNCRLNLGKTTASERRTVEHAGVATREHPHAELAGDPHESPPSMTIPLIILAACSILLGFLGTPAWPWFQKFLGGEAEGFNSGMISLMAVSIVIVFFGLGIGWWFYGRNPMKASEEPDPVQTMRPDIYFLLHHKYFIDEIYERTIIAFNAWFARFCDALDFWLWNGIVQLVSYLIVGISWANSFFDHYVVNGGFDEGCKGVHTGGKMLSRLQNGRVQSYLRVIGIALAVLALLLIWGVPSVMSSFAIISLLTFLPFGGAIVLAFTRGEEKVLARRIALGTSLIALGLALGMCGAFDSSLGTFQFEERHAWIPSLGVEYRVGVDGLGLLMVLLTALITPMAMLASWRNEDRPHLYFSMVLFLEAGLLGTFTALNFFHWFLFWELSLVPAFFLVRLWGGPQRAAAAMQFFIYTMVGSIALLLAFLGIFLATKNGADAGVFDFTRLAEIGRSNGIVTGLSGPAGWHLFGHVFNASAMAQWIFLGALLGFAVKVPLMPFHTWLPATYAEAPSGTTMLLTGVMSKMGVYGFLRILLPIFPNQLHALRAPLLVLAVVTIVFSASAAFAQKDLKRIFAYSSINHLGYCLLAIFAVATTGSNLLAPAAEKAAALSGVFLQMFNHGLTAATLFWFIALLEQRSGGLRGLNDFGGLRKVAPVFCGLMGIALFSSLGLPGLNGFIGEFLIFKGVFPLAMIPTALSVIGLLVTAIFILTVLQRVFNGPLNEKWSTLPDLTLSERALLAIPIALMLVLGVYPQLLLSFLNPTVTAMVKQLPF